MKKGFTLVEVILYVGVVSILACVMGYITLGTIKNYRLVKIKDELAYSSWMVFDNFFQETKNADDISLSSSVFDNDSGTLSLKTSFQTNNKEPGFIDLYLYDGQVWIKRTGYDPFSLTSEGLIVERLRFEKISLKKFDGIKLYLDLKDKKYTNEVFSISTFVMLRGGYLK